MNPLKSPRVHWLLWLAFLGFLVALALFPVSYRSTRLASLGLGLALWVGLIALTWRWHLVRFVLLGITFLIAGFFLLPAHGRPSVETLRTDYLTGLRRYEGVRYYWGGETARGIDCSGLVRRGLIDALFWRGIRTFHPGVVREAFSLWWHGSVVGWRRGGLVRRSARVVRVDLINRREIEIGPTVIERAVHDAGRHGGGRNLNPERVGEMDPQLHILEHGVFTETGSARFHSVNFSQRESVCRWVAELAGGRVAITEMCNHIGRSPSSTRIVR